MKPGFYETIFEKSERASRRMDRELARQGMRDDRAEAKRERRQPKIQAEIDRRREVAQIDRLDSSVLRTLGVLAASKELEHHSYIRPLTYLTRKVKVDSTEDNSRDGTQSIGIALGLEICRNRDRDHGVSNDYLRFLIKNPEYRKNRVWGIGAYVFKLDPATQETGREQAKLLDSVHIEFGHFFLSNIDKFTQVDSTSPVVNYSERKQFEFGEGRKINTFLDIAEDYFQRGGVPELPRDLDNLVRQ